MTKILSDQDEVGEADGAGGVVGEVAVCPVLAGEAEVLCDGDEIGETDAAVEGGVTG